MRQKSDTQRTSSFDTPYFVLFMMNALYFMVASTFTPYLAAYYRALDFSMLEVGALAAVGSVSSILIQPFWSHLSDRMGNRLLVLRIVLVGCTATILLFLLPRSFVGLFLVVVVFQAFFTAVMPVQDAISLTYCNQRRKSYAGVRVGGTIGYALLVIFAGKIVGNDADTMRRMFLMASAGFFLMLLLTRSMPRDDTGVASRRIASIGVLLRNRRFALFLLWAFAFQVGISFIFSFLPVHIRNLGLSTTHIGYAMCISAVSELPVLLLLDRVLKKRSPAQLLLFAGAALVVRLVLTSVATDFTGIALAQVFHGACFMTAFYCNMQLVNREVPSELKASGLGLLALVQSGMASILSSIGGGWLSDHLSIPAVMRLDAIFVSVLVATATLVYLFRARIPFLRQPDSVPVETTEGL